MGIHARASSTNAGYRFIVRNDGNAYLYINNLPASDLGGFPHGLTLAADTDYWMRFKVYGTQAGGDLRIQGRVWEDGNTEPGTWLVDYDHTEVSEVRAIEGSGYVGISNGGGGGWLATFYSKKAYRWPELSTDIAPGPPPPPPPPPEPPQLPELGPVPSLDAPVTLRFSESLTGVFADPTIDASFFELVDLPVGGRYALGDQLSGQDWYSFAIRDRTRSRGIIAYQGETLLARLGRVTPRESLILVAGIDGVPNPLDLRECLRRFLIYYGVPFVDDLPVFALRVGDQMVAPQVGAFVIQPDPESPDSIYTLLERFFGPFRGYTFRADTLDRLVVTPPAWVDTIGLKLTVYRRRQDNDRTPVRFMAVAPWSTTRAPVVSWQGFIDGVPIAGTLPNPLEQSDVSYETVSIGPFTVRVYWLSSAEVRLWVNPVPSDDVSTGSLFTVTFTFRAQPAIGNVDALELSNEDLAPDEVETSSADSVINQAIVHVRRLTFEADQGLMQPASLVMRSPTQLAAGVFGNNPPFGPMDWSPTTPDGFLELVNDHVQSGSWFWPVDPGVVMQPGGSVAVSYDVEEWAEQWNGPGSREGDAAQANTFTGSATLEANGLEVKLFDFQFPRQSTNFAPGAYGARGSVYGRWRAGTDPGIELRVADARFVEFGFVPELGPFGQTYYFLWGAIVELNGSGVTFTVGDLETYRFGFSRAEDGTWEDGAEVPSLAESQHLYPDRVFTAQELPYDLDPETALAIARGIVEENLSPKTVYSLPIAASRADGWAAKPWFVGRGAIVTAPGLNIAGRVTALDYSETHTAAGSQTELTIDVEVAQPPIGSRAGTQRFGRAAYGVSHYGQAEEI